MCSSGARSGSSVVASTRASAPALTSAAAMEAAAAITCSQLSRTSRRGFSRNAPATRSAGAGPADGRLSVADVARELIPASRDGSDEITIGAEDLAQRGDLGLEVVFLDDAVRPHAPHQPVLVDNGAARVDQRDQRVEGSPAQLDGPAVDEQLTPMTDNLESTELQRGGE